MNKPACDQVCLTVISSPAEFVDQCDLINIMLKLMVPTQAMVEVPYVLAQAVIYGVITYFMIQFEFVADKFFWYFLFVFLSLVFFAFFGLMTTSICANPELAVLIIAVFESNWFAFGGFLIAEKHMPDWWSW